MPVRHELETGKTGPSIPGASLDHRVATCLHELNGGIVARECTRVNIRRHTTNASILEWPRRSTQWWRMAEKLLGILVLEGENGGEA